MPEFFLLMHNDAEPGDRDWGPYLARLDDAGVLRGGSAIGAGLCVRKDGRRFEITDYLTGYICIEAEDLEAALAWIDGNPIYEAGGTIELRGLPKG